MKKITLTLAAVLCYAMTTLLFTACSIEDNPVPEPVYPETPGQRAFWQQFDGWQTDSCTVGDDFFMHVVGSWWKNPVDIYPQGLIRHAAKVNNQRVSEIIQTNTNLQHLSKHLKASLSVNMSKEEVDQMVKAKVDELWAGATTREEALAAMGRAWAQGYTFKFEPIVDMINGEPTWLLTEKIPSFVTVNMLQKNKEEWWRLYGTHQIADMTSRRAQDANADLGIIIQSMCDDINHIVIDYYIAEEILKALDNEWSTVEGIKNEIERNVRLLDGVLVSDDCLAEYNQELAKLKEAFGVTNDLVLDRKSIANSIGMYMGNLYILNDYNQLYITPKVRQQYTKWCEQFREAMRQRIEANTWLENATRQNALDKLDNIVFYVGGISVIPDIVIPTLNGKDIIEDVHQLYKARLAGYCWAATQQREVVAKLVQNLRYIQDATIDNASYSPNYNIVNINPSNLCEPYVQDDYEDALEWAFIGTTIGHELTHGFDNSGSKYDLWGNAKNWWTEADAAKFTALCDQLTDQYNNLQLMPWADPTLCGDGEKTLGENIADIGGCCLALQILLGEHPNATAAEKKALIQRFFQGWAIQWSITYDLDFLKYMKEVDVHSQARERTNGVVRNIDEWYDAYDVKSGTLYLAPDKRVRIW